MKKISLTRQLIYICILIISIIFIALCIILPNELLPIYEENIYNKIKQPLYFISNIDEINTPNNYNTDDIAYIFIINNNIATSNNISDIVKNYNKDIIKYLNNNYGKFIYQNKIYYYYCYNIDINQAIITITNDKYINTMKKDILYTIILVTGLSFTLCSLIIITWSNNLVNNIIIIKNKIKHINDQNYTEQVNLSFNDEIYSLNESIESMKNYLIENENYKNQVYQNISHDFKTPISVIKSYIEAAEDGIETNEECLEVIKEQTNKLESKVHSLLYLNKLNYLKEKDTSLKSKTNVSNVIFKSIEKFKIIRPEINWKLEINKTEIYRGTEEMWEAIIDNILNNFMRYAKKEIKIEIKNNKIIFFNDGEQIDEKIINNIFTQYEKGLNGMFGLGLSIVEKTLQILNYDITVKNLKNGVNFIIK